ncbi:MAG: TonB family protein [Alphaproteobacteria bacterium]|nr:TonB family protein [Alphaproteobacteria bacterium]
MIVSVLAWLISLGIHLGFALFMLLPASGTALEKGAGDDIMVVEQGIVLEGFAKLGDDLVTVEAVDVPTSQAALAQPLIEEKPLLEEVKPIEEQQVIASDAGPEQINVKEPEEEVEERDLEEVEEVVEKPEPEVVEQPLPPQIAALDQTSVVPMRESSGDEQEGGSTTEHTAYLGKLRTHLEQHKINPRTQLIGTAVVAFTVDASGEISSRRLSKSSGSKVLDEAAIASIERAAPFPPIPTELGRNHLEVSVPFKFTVR